MFILTFDRLIKNAPASVVWDVIADVERYADYAPNLSQAIKTSEGSKPSRRCTDNQGRSWDETCTLWQEGEVYSYEVNTTAPDYPYPFKQLKGTWGLHQEHDGVRVTMQFDYTPKAPPVLRWLMHQQMKRMFRPTIDELFDNWEAEIKAQMQQPA
jgi:ribosome-associated toxin RatA of RatAB toxin-antitoxin module